MSDDAQPYGIGSDTWPGLAKLMEEMGELQQVLGKIMACEGTNAIYWDGSSLRPHLVEELGDVRAAMMFFCEVNGVTKNDVHTRAREKLEKFRYWHANTKGARSMEQRNTLTIGAQSSLCMVEIPVTGGTCGSLPQEAQYKYICAHPLPCPYHSAGYQAGLKA